MKKQSTRPAAKRWADKELVSRLAAGDTSAIEAVGKIGPKALPALLAAWKGPIPDGVHPIDFLQDITAGVEAASRDDASALIEVVRAEELPIDPLLWLATCALSRSRDPHVNDVLLDLLGHRSSLLRETAAAALIERKELRAIDPLIRLLQRSQPSSLLFFTIVGGLHKVPKMQDLRMVPILQHKLTRSSMRPGARSEAKALLRALLSAQETAESRTVLDWTGQSVTKARLSLGARCTSLKVLVLNNVARLTPAALREIATWRSLEELELEWDENTPTLDAEPLGALTSLRRLSLRNIRLQDPSARFLSRLTALEELCILGVALGPAAYDCFLKLRRLRVLWLEPIPLQSEPITGPLSARPSEPIPVAEVCRATSLESLRLDASPIDVRAARAIGRLSRLRRLQLYYSRLEDDGLEALGPLPELRYLQLPGSQITAEGVRLLEQFPKLTHLDLDGARIGDAGVKRLSRIRGLQELSLRRCGVSDQSVPYFKAMPHLETLNVYRQLSKAARKELEETIPGLKIN